MLSKISDETFDGGGPLMISAWTLEKLANLAWYIVLASYTSARARDLVKRKSEVEAEWWLGSGCGGRFSKSTGVWSYTTM